MAERLFKIKGINDDESTCGVCGKEQLKRVVWLENTETGEVFAAGTTCAARLQKIAVKEQKKLEKDFEAAQLEAARNEIWPFRVAAGKVNEEAPSTFGPGAVTFKERIAFIHNHQATKELYEKEAEIKAKYGVKYIPL